MILMARRVTLDSCVRGYHVFKDIWNPAIGDTLLAKPEFGNSHDPYAVAVVTSDDIVVGHLPRNISTLCHIFLRRSGSILVQVSGRRRYSRDLPQGGLELPCSLVFIGEVKDLQRIEKLKTAIPPIAIAIQPQPKRAKVTVISDEEDSDSDSQEKDGVWLKFSGNFLTYSDKEKLLNGKLNDRHINCAQTMLRSQFPNAEGLGHTLLQKRKPLTKIECGLQIIHDRGDHWIVASNIGCDRKVVQVYDSIYTAVAILFKQIAVMALDDPFCCSHHNRRIDDTSIFS